MRKRNVNANEKRIKKGILFFHFRPLNSFSGFFSGFYLQFSCIINGSRFASHTFYAVVLRAMAAATTTTPTGIAICIFCTRLTQKYANKDTTYGSATECSAYGDSHQSVLGVKLKSNELRFDCNKTLFMDGAAGRCDASAYFHTRNSIKVCVRHGVRRIEWKSSFSFFIASNVIGSIENSIDGRAVSGRL